MMRRPLPWNRSTLGTTTLTLLLALAGFGACSGPAESDETGGESGGAASDGSGAAGPSDGGLAGSGGGSGIGNTGGSLLGQGGEGGNSDGPSECNDGIDNDDDGQTDYAFDPGCYGPGDATESAGTRAEEAGFSTWEFGDDSVVVYVSADGDDAADGATPETAVQTLERGAELVRDGEHDFLLLRRGDTFRDQALGRFKSGRDAAHPLVVGSYGEALELPRLEIAEELINHDGQTKSFLALLDLHVVAYAKDPTDPEFDGSTGGGLRLVGNGSNILIEGCHLEYAELILQSYGANGEKYSDVEVRANVIEKAYHADTCTPGDPNGSDEFRPSGVYSSHVDGLLIEGNVLDHNGWNEEVESACATIYNHNLYLNANDLVIRDNVFSRASSIHIKLRSDTSGEMTGIAVAGNYFVEGEIGVSIGGNTEEPYRFVDSTITGNVFSDVGRSQPTTRTLAWGIDVQDNDGLTIAENFFLNQRQPGVNNSWAVHLNGGTNRDISVVGNFFYRIQSRAFLGNQEAGHELIDVGDNTFVDPDQGARLVQQNGTFAGYTYSANRYFSSAESSAWFELESGDVSFDDWTAASGEDDATVLDSMDYPDPDRTIESYAQTLGLDDSLTGYLAEARQQTRLRWHYELSAPAINDYIRAGFGE